MGGGDGLGERSVDFLLKLHNKRNLIYTRSGKRNSRALRSLVYVSDAPPAFIRHWRRRAPVPKGEPSTALLASQRLSSGAALRLGVTLRIVTPKKLPCVKQAVAAAG